MARLSGGHLHLDCFAGLAGDMFLGAAIDLGVPEEVIRAGLAGLGLERGAFELEVRRTKRMAIEGCDVKVRIPDAQPEAGHHHHHRWRDIRSMIEGATLAQGARGRALDIFNRVARAEAKLHGVELEEVQFHEVGAVDSIVDIVGAAVALDYLSPTRVTSRPIPLGHGTTRCAHGVLPVPAPATLEILRGASVEDGGVAMELCTPTGAAIAASCVDAYTPTPAAAVIAVGYGAGDIQLDDRPNHLRAILFESATEDEAEREAVVVEANVDNMPPEWCGHLMDRLFAAGARDVWYSPIVMKKGRPALTISALCAPAKLEVVGGVLLAESTTIGYRYYRAGRRVLGRRFIEVETRYGRLTIKQALDGEVLVNSAPEHDVCRAAAERHNVPLKEVYAAALAAVHNLADSDGIG